MYLLLSSNSINRGQERARLPSDRNYRGHVEKSSTNQGSENRNGRLDCSINNYGEFYYTSAIHRYIDTNGMRTMKKLEPLFPIRMHFLCALSCSCVDITFIFHRMGTDEHFEPRLFP